MEQTPIRESGSEHINPEGSLNAQSHKPVREFLGLVREVEAHQIPDSSSAFVRSLRAGCEFWLQDEGKRLSIKEMTTHAEEGILKTLYEGLLRGDVERLISDANSRKLGAYIMCDLSEHLHFVELYKDAGFTAHTIGNSLRRILSRRAEDLASHIGEDETESAYILRLFATVARNPEAQGSRFYENILGKHVGTITTGLAAHPKEYAKLSEFAAHFGSDRASGVISDVAATENANGRFAVLANLLSSSYKKSSALGDTIAAQYLQNFGLDHRQLSGKWKLSAPRQRLESCTERNLKRVHDLEKTFPGAVAVLSQEFGICDFARYPIGLLMQQFRERHGEQKPYGIILYPAFDHNGTFYDQGEIFDKLHAQLQGRYALRIVECATKRDMARRLLTLDRQYGKISFAIVGGHGTADSIQFGDPKETRSRESYRLFRDDLSGKGVRRAPGFFVEHPQIILVSCNTGSNDGIAQRLSALFGADVTAPDKRTNVSSIRARFNEKGTMHLDAEYLQGERKYVEGQSLS